MLLDALVLSVAIGLVRGGSLLGFARLELRRPAWIVGAFLLQYLLVFLAGRGWGFAQRWGPWVYGGSFVVLLVGLWANRHRRELATVAAGVFLNALVILANGGHMPVSLSAVAAAGMGREAEPLVTDTLLTHQILTESSRLALLADVIPLPRPYPRPRVFSVGDLLMVIGVFWLVQRTMLRAGRDPARA